MNEKLFKEIQLETGAVLAEDKDYTAVRATLCHPVLDSDDMCTTNDEAMVNARVLKTPIECGDHAFIYHGQSILGAVGDDGKLYISGEGLKTPGRAREVNALLAYDGHSLDPKTWIYSDGKLNEFLGSKGLLVTADGIESIHENTVSEQSDNKIKFYIDYIIELLSEYDGLPEVAMHNARESGYKVREGGYEYSGIADMIDTLTIPEDLIMDALRLRGLDAAQSVAGQAIWSLKQDMTNIIKAVLDLPTQFKT